MGKRSDGTFERRAQDFYSTPRAAMEPLLPFLSEECTYAEPCAGDGRLIGYLAEAGHMCLWASDIEPKANFVHIRDARTLRMNGVDYFITNPPWSRPLLHPIIENLSSQLPTWLLLDADWLHTRQAAPYIQHLRAIVSVGRVKWIEDSPYTGKDNCAWMLFDQNCEGPALFFGRSARVP